MRRSKRMSNSKQRGTNMKKRKSDQGCSVPANATENDTPTMALFRTYQIELDAKYDKHERLVKKSRDLTIESKRIIFLLHRVTSSGNNEDILLEAQNRLTTLFMTVINEIALDLKKREVYQHLRAFTGGLQEFVEAVSFYHYLRHGKVISLEEIHSPDFLEQSFETSEEEVCRAELPLSALLTPVEFVLGIADLTGELMRKCINSVGAGDIEEPFKLSILLQNIYEALLLGCSYSKDLKRKLVTLRSSVQKVETACYAIRIRGTETPKHMLADFFSAGDDEYKDEGLDM